MGSGFRYGFGMFVAALLGASTYAASQMLANPTISLTVKDESGAVIPRAKVSITREETGTKVGGQTDEMGMFYTAPLAPGKYHLRIEFPGFNSNNSLLELSAGEARNLAVVMSIAWTAKNPPEPLSGPGIELITSTWDADLLDEGQVRSSNSQVKPQPHHNVVQRFFSSVAHKLHL